MTDWQDPRLESVARPRRRSPSLALSLLLSVAVHVVVLVLYPLWMERLSPDLPQVPFDEITLEGTEVIVLREVDEDDPTEEATEEAPPTVERVPVPVPVPTERPPRPAPPEPDRVTRTPAERLRPNEDNTRLWIPVDPQLTELTPEEQLQLEIDMVLKMWNDSMARLAEEQRASTDWTHTDADGNKWGISPGKLHLGKVTLPLPIYFGPANGVQRDELARRAYELGDIERGALAGAVRESMKERAAAIRKRRDAEREAARADGDEAEKKEAPPDTTRRRR